jgi:hypothetical protein
MLRKNWIMKFFGLTVVGFLFYSIGWAQGSLPLTEIVNNVLKNTKPIKSYSVPVIQTVSKLNIPLSKQKIKQTPFTVNFHPSKGFTTKKVKQPKASGVEQPQDILITMDMNKFLKDLLDWEGVSTTVEELSGRSHYKISGQASGNGLSCILWVDGKRWHVSKIALYIKGKKFSESNIEHRLASGKFWLPSKLIIDHASDGTHVIQEFGKYLFLD